MKKTQLNEHHGRIEGFDPIVDEIIYHVKEIVSNSSPEQINDDNFNKTFYLDISEIKGVNDKYNILSQYIRKIFPKTFICRLTNDFDDKETNASINVKKSFIRINAKMSYETFVENKRSEDEFRGTIIHELTHFVDITKKNYKQYFLGGKFYDNLEFTNPITKEKVNVRKYLNPEIEDTIHKILYRFDPSEIQSIISETLDNLKGDEYAERWIKNSIENKERTGFKYKMKYIQEDHDWISSIITTCGTGLVTLMDNCIGLIEKDSYELYKNDFMSVCKEQKDNYQTQSLIFSLLCYCQTYRKYCHIYILDKLPVNEDEYNQYKYYLNKELTKRRRNVLQKVSKIVYDLFEDKINDMNKDSFKQYAKNEIMKNYNEKSKNSKYKNVLKSIKRVYSSIFKSIMDL